MCDNDVLKDKLKVVERKGLTHSLDFPNVFKIEWIKIVLSRIHVNSIWLEYGPIKIIKMVVQRIIGYPTLDIPNTMISDAKEIIEKNTREIWNKRGMAINAITNPLISFAVRIIAHKFFQSSRLNSYLAFLLM